VSYEIIRALHKYFILIYLLRIHTVEEYVYNFLYFLELVFLNNYFKTVLHQNGYFQYVFRIL